MSGRKVATWYSTDDLYNRNDRFALVWKFTKAKMIDILRSDSETQKSLDETVLKMEGKVTSLELTKRVLNLISGNVKMLRISRLQNMVLFVMRKFLEVTQSSAVSSTISCFVYLDPESNTYYEHADDDQVYDKIMRGVVTLEIKDVIWGPFEELMRSGFYDNHFPCSPRAFFDKYLFFFNHDTEYSMRKFMQRYVFPRPPEEDEHIGGDFFIKTLTGKTITIRNGCKNFTVFDLMHQVQNQEGITPCMQRLIFAGKQLEGYRTITEYRIEKDSTIHLVLNLRGGKPVILMYPQTAIPSVQVTLSLDPEKANFLTHYPKTKSSKKRGSEKTWIVSNLQPSGIFEYNDHKYPSLFWECKSTNFEFFRFTSSGGAERKIYRMRSKYASDFLYRYLLGVYRMKEKDINEMITFWISELEQEEYVAIQFMEKEKYEKFTHLKITPEPDQVIKVFMLFKTLGRKDEELFLEEGVVIDLDEALEFDEVGKVVDWDKFVVYEWGGMRIV